MIKVWLKKLLHFIKTYPQRLRRKVAIKKSERCIFVDCGANTCNVLREHLVLLPSFEFYAFEAQPELADEGVKVVKEFPDRKIHFFNQAVWTENTHLDFFLAKKWGENYRGGSTLVSNHTKNLGAVDYDNPTRVEAIDFSAWLGNHVTENDYVIVKMDIEGAEYDVLEKVIADGNQKLVDEFMVEFHYQMNDSIPKQRHDKLVEKLRRNGYLEIWR